jgi:pilus assembly protein Flp/PilA
VKSPPEKDRRWKPATRFLTDDAAATAVEYAVMLLLILMVLISAVAALGSQTGSLWGDIKSQLQSVGFIH